MNGGNEIPNYVSIRTIYKYKSLEVNLPQELNYDNRKLAWRKIAKWRRQKGCGGDIPVHATGVPCPYINFCVLHSIPCDEINKYVYDLLQQQAITE